VGEECHAAASARPIEARRALPLARARGDGATSSSHGRLFRAGGRGEALGDTDARRGGEPGVAFRTHAPDRFGPFHAKATATAGRGAARAGRAPAAPDAGPPPAGRRTDAGGATDRASGLPHRLGFRLAPRLRDLEDRRPHASRGPAVPDPLAGPVGGTTDAGHGRAHRDEPPRLAVPVRPGHASASGTPRRLAAYPRRNGPAVALREGGRIGRTLPAPDRPEDLGPRRRANAGPDKGTPRRTRGRPATRSRGPSSW
jgi:TnpA family transposase